jgi:hypothetical protein
MTGAQFYEKLEEIKDTFKWDLNYEGDGEIRAKFKNNQGREFCPITAIVYRVTGKKFSTEDFDDAAKAINLNEKFAQTVVHSADNDWQTSKKTRRRLLNILK